MSDKMQNPNKKLKYRTGLKAHGLALIASLIMLAEAHATGLGKLTVLSALGQPLKAEIELTSPNKDEIGSLVPKIASPEAYKRANIEYSPYISSLQFALEQRGSGYVIKVTSTQPMNEPFIDLLIELNSSNGKILREYTFLLDPPEIKAGQSAQVTGGTGIVSKPSNSTSSINESSQAKPSPEPNKGAGQGAGDNSKNTPVSGKPSTGGTDYGVKRGDTLSKIANSHKFDGVSLDQMLVGLYKANPHAFSGKNMNRLKAGQIITIPTAEALVAEAGSSSQARAVVRTHTANFHNYRHQLADRVEAMPARDQSENKQTGKGKITTRVTETPTASNESVDKLKLSKAEADKKAKAIEEEKIAKSKAEADAAARVKELEKNVSDLQKVLEVKNKDLANKQAEANKANQVTPATTTASASKPVAPAPTPASASASAVTASTPAVSPASASASAIAETASQASSASATASQPTTASQAEANAASQAAAEASSKRKRRVAPPPPPPPEPSILDMLMDNLMLVGAGVLALGGGIGALWWRRRKQSMQQFEDSILTGSNIRTDSMIAASGGQSVDTNNSVFNSNFSPSASQLDANEVDPVAEADVYIAYGRDTQAEDILREALRTQPDRHAVRLKLLEIYFSRKDPRSFERIASELYSMTGGLGEEWEHASSMGVALDPDNPLYAGGRARSVQPEAVLGSGTRPADELDPEALLNNSVSLDMLEAISMMEPAKEQNGQAPAQPLSPADTPPNDDGVLDFTLDLPDMDFQSTSKPMSSLNATSTPAPTQSHDEVESLDFNLAGDAPALEPASAPAPAPVAQVSEEFNLDLPSNTDELVDTSAPATLDLGVNIPVVGEESNAPLNTSNDDEVKAQPLPPEAEAFEFDLSGIDFTLDNEKPAQVNSSSDDNAADDASQLANPHNAEMATKLDLAVAYSEIGDKEGAKELLEEVLKGGSKEQIQRAKNLMNQLD